VPWRIDQVDDESHVIVLIVEADVRGFDSHLTLLLLLHKVHRQSRSRQRWREQSRTREETVGHRRLTVIHVRDDADVADLVFVGDDL